MRRTGRLGQPFLCLSPLAKYCTEQNCSTLWPFLFVASPHWTDELLAGPMAAPLKVYVDPKYSMQLKEVNHLGKVAPQAYRVQDLRLRLTRQEAEHILPLFSSCAPLLQNLRL